MQTLLLTLIFIGIYTVVKVIIVEYAHDKNMHEQCARTKISRMYKKIRQIETIADDSAPIAVCARNAPTPIAVHRRRAQKRAKLCIFSTQIRSLRPDSIYAYPKFQNNPFTPTLQNPKISFNTIFCVGKNIYLYLPL